MLVFILNVPYGRLGAVLSALIVISSLIGLTLNRECYASLPRRDFSCYFTNLSNLAVLLYFALIAPQLYARGSLHPYIPLVEFCVTMWIMLTHIVFHFLVFPFVRTYTRQASSRAELRIMAVNTLFVHYLVPWLTLAYWLLCAPGKARLPLSAALLWTLAPLLYIVWALLRARLFGNIPGLNTAYPYPFLDVETYGPRCVLRSCAGLFAAGVALSGMLLLGIRLLFSCFGGGHALFLI